MRFTDVIAKKRDGHALTKEEIDFWIEGISNKTVPDYQSSALLMAITLNGMDMDETTALTNAMVHSGNILDLSPIHGIKVDKHSTGGVGDKTSIVIGPIVAACGGKVAKMSGRGLGHTGGTLDKLESIAGFNINMTQTEFMQQVNDINIGLIGQSDDLVYADKVLYSLRDVTATVQSLPLIAASIMSKKIAGGADAIVLDVKYGDGAFMSTQEEATELAKTMITIGQNLDRDVTALITNMNQPLGETVGNALEIYEAIRTLQNSGPKDLTQISLEASAHMLYHGNQASSIEEGLEMATEALKSGQAFKVFKTWIVAQGGNIEFIDNLGSFIDAKYRVSVYAEEEGYIEKFKTQNIGLISSGLGAGRDKVEDEIDYTAGIILNRKTGEYVKKGDLLGMLQSNSKIDDALVENFKACFVLSEKEIETPQLIADVL